MDDLLEVFDVQPGRIRRPTDLLRIVVLLLVVGALTGVGAVAGATTRGVNADMTRLLADIPHVFVRLFSVLGATGALAAPIAFIARELIRGQPRRLIEAILTGLLADVVIDGLNRSIRSAGTTALRESLVHAGSHGSSRPLDAYLAALFAFAAVIGVAGDLRWRSLLIGVTVLYVVSAFTATQASLLSLLLSPAIGAVIGAGARWAVGTINSTPDARAIAAELARRDLHLARMERVATPETDHRTYRCVTIAGRGVLVQAYDRDLIISGAVYTVYRLARLRTEIAATPALTLDRIAEHRSLLALAGAHAGAPIPELLAGVPCGPDTIVLAYDQPVSTGIDGLSDGQLEELWTGVERLHHHRITHHGLVADQIRLDPSGKVLLPILSEGSVFATDLRISVDRAQLLVTTAALVGADRAVRSARGVLTDDELAATLPVLQPIALTRDARAIAAHHHGLLDALRLAVAEPIAEPTVELANLERVRPRSVIAIVAVLVAGYLLVVQFGSIDVRTVFGQARWVWLPLVVVASAATYVAAAVSLTGYVEEKLNFAHTVLAQVAASFVGFVTPPSVGGLALNVRYLRKANVSTTGAATSVGVSQVVNAALHVVLLIACVAATGASAHHSLPIPGWAFVAVAVLGVLALAVLAVPISRHWLRARVLPPVREALPRIMTLATSPVKLTESVGGALMLNVFYVVTLWSCARAFDAHVGLAQVAVVYLTGAAIGSAAPTPGGLGAVEIAMSTGLTALGTTSAAAISTVLLFRLATFIVPVPFGLVAMRWLQHHQAL